MNLGGVGGSTLGRECKDYCGIVCGGVYVGLELSEQEKRRLEE